MAAINLSVIIPHYNSTDTLERLLATIPDREDVQVIVVDDRSSEEEREKLRSVAERYPHAEYYDNDREKKGAGTCRNIGLEKAEGEWLAFADADDYFLPGMYGIVSPYFTSDYEIVFFPPVSVKLPSGEPGDRHRMYETAVKMYLRDPSFANYMRMKASIGNAAPWSKMIRAQVVKKHNLKYSEIMYCNDAFFWVKAGLYAKKVAASPKRIYCVTDSDGSLTHDMSWEAYWIKIKEHVRMCRFCLKKYPPSELRYIHAEGGHNVIGTLLRGYGISRALTVFRRYRQYRIPMLTTETFKLLYFRSVLFRS